MTSCDKCGKATAETLIAITHPVLGRYKDDEPEEDTKSKGKPHHNKR